MSIITTFIVDPAVQDPIVSGPHSISVAGNESGPFSVNEGLRLVVKGKQQAYRNDAGDWVFPLLTGKLTDYGGDAIAELYPLPTTDIGDSNPPARVWTADFEADSDLCGCDCELRVTEDPPYSDSTPWTFHFDLGQDPCNQQLRQADDGRKETLRKLDDVRRFVCKVDPCSLISVSILKPFLDVDTLVKKGDVLHIITNFPEFKLVVPLIVEAYTVTDTDQTSERLDKLRPELVASGFPDNRKQLFRLYIPKTVKPQSRYIEIHVRFVGGSGTPCKEFLKFKYEDEKAKN